MHAGDSLHDKPDVDEPLKRELYALVREDPAIFDFLQDGSLDGVWYLNLDNHDQIWLSPRFCAVFGYAPHEIQAPAAFFGEALLAADIERAQGAFRAHCADPRVPYDEVLRYRHRDGSVVWVRCRGMAIRDKDGRPTRMLGAHTDLTAIKRAEAERAAAEAQRDADRRFAALAEELPQLVFTCDAHGAFDYVSRRWLAFAGLPAEDLLGRGLLALVHPDDRARVEAGWAAAQAAGSHVALEHRMRRADGTYRWLDTRASPVRGPEGEPLRWIGASTDIHETYETRAALKARQEQLAGIVATSPGAVFTFRLDAGGAPSFPFASDSAQALYGLAPAAITSDAQVVFERVHADDLGPMLACIEHSRRELTAWHFEYRYAHPDQSTRWLAGHSLPSRDADGGTTWSGVVLDVTEHKQRELELSIVKAQLDAAMEAADMGAFVTDLEAGRVWNSGPLRRLYGFGPEVPPYIGLDDALHTVHPDDRQRVYQEISEQLAKRQRVNTEFRIVRGGDGAVRWMATRARIARGTSGLAARLVGVTIDVTQQKQAIEAEARSHKLEALGTLSGGIAHDFNNVLQAITGRAALALNTLASSHPARQHVDEIGKAAVHASELVSRILSFSRPRDQLRTPIRLPEVINEALGLVRATIPSSIELRTVCAPDVPLVTADATEVHQIVINLATNAAHAIGRRHGVVEVVLERVEAEAELGVPSELRPGVYARLSFSDDGIGMDADTLARVFDPYFTTKPVGEGTGLGLAVVSSLMRSLGGSITAYSQPGKGSTFRLYFPESQAAVATPPPAPRASLPRGRGERVLFVDDELALAALGREMLRHLGYVADTYNDPAQALEAFRAAPESYAAAITDLSMPGLSGAELSRALLAIRPDLPIVLMSGYAPPEERERALADGVARIMLKPVSLPVFASLLSELLPG